MCRSSGNAWKDPPSSIYKGNVVGKLFGIGRSSIALASASYTRLSLGWCSVSHPQFVLEMFSMNTECAGEFDFPSGWWRVHRMSPRFSLLLINRCSSIWRRDDTRNASPKWKVFASQRITKRSATSTLFPCPKAWFFSLSHFLSPSLSLSFSTFSLFLFFPFRSFFSSRFAVFPACLPTRSTVCLWFSLFAISLPVTGASLNSNVVWFFRIRSLRPFSCNDGDIESDNNVRMGVTFWCSFT